MTTNPTALDAVVRRDRQSPTEPVATAIAPPALRRRRRWRLRVLLAIDFMVLVLFVISQLEPAQVKPLGPALGYVYELLNPADDEVLSTPSQDLVSEVATLGGQTKLTGHTPKLVGLFRLPGRRELFQVSLRGPAIDDNRLADLIDRHGDGISGLVLADTALTDLGLASLQRLSALEQLELTSDRGGQIPHAGPTRITDNGLAQLKIPSLTNLNLGGQPITDDGLKHLAGLHGLQQLYLSRTGITGPGLVHLKGLPNLTTLILTDTALNEVGLRHLASLPNLTMLSLEGVPMTAESLKLVAAARGLRWLSVRHCGLLDEEVKAFQTTVPGLRIER